MKEVLIDATKESFKHLDVGTNPTRIVFVNVEHSALQELHLYGNVSEMGVLPHSIKRLYLNCTGSLHILDLPVNLEILKIFTEYTTVDYLPNNLLELHAVDPNGELEFGNCTKLRKLVVLGRKVYFFELPISPKSINCTPIEERIDLRDFESLLELILTNARGLVLDLSNSKLQRLDLIDCTFQRVVNIPDCLVTLNIQDTTLHDYALTLPDRLKVMNIHRVKDGNGELIPFPPKPKGLLYCNGSSLHSRR